MATKLEGGGGVGVKDLYFFAASLRKTRKTKIQGGRVKKTASRTHAFLYSTNNRNFEGLKVKKNIFCK